MVYLVEDDAGIRELVTYTLSNTGFEIEAFPDAAGFWPAMARRRPRLVLLDIMLPGEDGLTILKKIRRDAATGDLPVILLTARGTEFDRVLGLDSGADDYLPKPFGMMELVARINSLLRRAERSEVAPEYRAGGLTVDVSGHVVTTDGRPAALTFKEFELLLRLIQNAGRVLSRDQLLAAVWSYEFDGETRTVDVHIRTLRAKLGAYGDWIHTVRGVGYKWEAMG